MGGSTGLKGPIIAYGTRAPVGSGGSENPELAPSIFWGGTGFIDPRPGYNVTRWGAIGIGGESAVVNVVPSTLAANNIAASQTPTAATPLTLVSSTGAGITVLAASLVVWGSGNTIPSGALAIDGAPGLVAFGMPQLSSGNTKVSFYDPTKTIARAVRVHSAGDDTAATFTVVGYDLYGYPMSETITGVNNGDASGKKAFKFITSITPAGTLSGSAVTAGTTDIYGFPMLSSFFGDVSILWNSAAITASTGYVAAVTTSPATATTGDVRGTYAVQSASDGTKRLMIYCNPSINNIALGVTGMFGVTQA